MGFCQKTDRLIHEYTYKPINWYDTEMSKVGVFVGRDVLQGRAITGNLDLAVKYRVHMIYKKLMNRKNININTNIFFIKKSEVNISPEVNINVNWFWIVLIKYWFGFLYKILLCKYQIFNQFNLFNVLLFTKAREKFLFKLTKLYLQQR